MRILIAEDEPVAARILTHYLSAYGACEFVADGDQALNHVQQALDEGDPYDLICLDIMMPGTDGEEALRVIRAMEEAMGVPPDRRARIAMTTAHDDPAHQAEALEGDADLYLVKPIRRDELHHELGLLGFAPA